MFRAQAFKLQHGIEHEPSQELAVVVLYLAELETLQLSAPPHKQAQVASLKGKEGTPGDRRSRWHRQKSRSGGKDKPKGDRGTSRNLQAVFDLTQISP